MAHPDLEDLLNMVLPFAQQTLVKYGEFLPFGASKSSGGEVSNAAVDLGVDRPPSQAVIDALVSAFRQAAGAGDIVASAICFDSRYRAGASEKPVDAICVRVERAGGEAVTVYQPYKKKMFGGYNWNDLVAAPLEPEIFTS